MSRISTANTKGWGQSAETVVIRYDSQGRPVYKNIYFDRLMSDELSLPALKALVFRGTFCEYLPHEVTATIVAYLNNSLGDDNSPLDSLRRGVNSDYSEKRRRLSELRVKLKDRLMPYSDDGWIGVGFDGDKRSVKAARITRDGTAITIDVRYFDSAKWNHEQSELLGMSDEYRCILVWLYDNKFL